MIPNATDEGKTTSMAANPPQKSPALILIAGGTQSFRINSLATEMLSVQTAQASEALPSAPDGNRTAEQLRR